MVLVGGGTDNWAERAVWAVEELLADSVLSQAEKRSNPRRQALVGRARSITGDGAVGGPFAKLGDVFGHENGQRTGLLNFGDQIFLRKGAVLGVSGVHSGDDGLLDFGA